MAKEKTLQDLFHDTLKDIYYAEKKILTALPKMAKAAQNPKLKAAFEKHRGETEEQVSRLEQVFASIDEKPQGKKCAAIEGILDEGKEIMDEYKGTPALDAGLISAAQAVEHYEICRYGTLATWADELGNSAGCEASQGDAGRRGKHRQSPERLWPRRRSIRRQRRHKAFELRNARTHIAVAGAPLQEDSLFVFFSNRFGIIGSIIVSILLKVVLLKTCAMLGVEVGAAVQSI